ncbi:MAG TPA: murein L,D-transpeptidase catalytic domain family protein [Parafilimonas sp.]|nr:murein L,D-transpeptidase catalytic domain family protein [Parafilimonas sp.]
MVKKLVLACALCIIVLTSMIAGKAKSPAVAVSDKNAGVTPAAENSNIINYWIDSLYTSMQLEDKGLSRSIFFAACKGYEYMLSRNALVRQGLLTICDYSQRSDKKRLYVLDLNQAKVLFNTYVSHGRNSGNDYATSFSNSTESHKTCLGFMRTAETYHGDNGYSLKLDGMEAGFNDNARPRAIVMHGSNYVNASRASKGTLMGRSYGCPAVPAAEARKIINCIKNGSCFFNYYPDNRYTRFSKILNADFIWPTAQASLLAATHSSDSLLKNLILADPVN